MDMFVSYIIRRMPSSYSDSLSSAKFQVETYSDSSHFPWGGYTDQNVYGGHRANGSTILRL